MIARSKLASFLFAALAATGTSVNPAAAQTVGATTGTGSAPALAPELVAIQQATERFKDFRVAEKEGYVRDPSNMCMTSTMEGAPRQLGGMGIHYFRPDLLGLTGTQPRVNGTGTHTDFARPAVLLYVPSANDSLELVAVENLVFQKAWTESGKTAPPSFLDNEYYLMVDNPLTPADEAHGFEPHYELHVWLFRENPNGMFSPFNPRVSCDSAHPAGPHTAQ